MAASVVDLPEPVGPVHFIDGHDARRNDTEDGARAEMVVHVIDTETRKTFDFICEVLIFVFDEPVPLFHGSRDFVEDILHFSRGDFRNVQRLQLAMNTDLGLHAGAEVQVRAALFDHGSEECVDFWHIGKSFVMRR